ncbi:MAG: amidohydrolase family protein [Proteobacteria bacterium]|nr:amidohydrolase family protein [Pseudomonadota bacterium]MDA1289422.1 amidohydrolase family protein [Pseudomonadota bacterium]
MNKLFLCALALPLGASLSASLVADTTVYMNVNGYTLNANRELQQFNAIQFTDDRVDRVFVQGEELPELADLLIDGDGQTLLPGLIDAHGHILSYGLSLLRVDLVGTQTEIEAVQRVADFAENSEQLEWIQGRGWNQVLWDSNEFPSAESLDAAVSEKPVWLSRVDGHAGWANSAAMELAGVDRQSEDPNGGQIIRDEDGNPTGVFIDNAMALIRSQIPAISMEEQKFALRTAMLELAKQGLTSVHDAGAGSDTIEAYKQLLDDGPLPIRVNVMLSAGDSFYEQRLAEGHYRSADDTLTMNSVKIAADGALGSRGAAMIDDYSDQSGHTGLLLHNPERLEYFMRAAMNAGFQVNTHAIGDKANKDVLDNYEQLIAETNSRDLRHRVEHAQILRYEDILRFAELGVIPSMQATHATSDKNMAVDRIGDVRIQGAYAWRKLIDAGALIANGSDFPVESPNPFFGLHAAITRQDKNNQPPGGWFPEEKMTAIEAFASFTIDAAYSGHQEKLLGTLEPGKKADFIILDRDIFAIDESEIWQIEVEKTWVNGQRVPN